MKNNINYYFDIPSNDIRENNDISFIFDEDAVKQSIINILKAKYYVKLLNPEFKNNILDFVFETIDNFEALRLQNEIERVILTFERRIKDLEVEVISREDIGTFEINIRFKIKNIERDIEFKTFLNKIR